MRFTIRLLLALLSIGALSGTLEAQDRRPLLRYPDIHENTVVFSHGADLWKVPSEGGIAIRLTIHDGEERFPKFSPNGSWIAFTGHYDGNADVYVMDPHGGRIRRVTFHPGTDDVVGWHPGKNKILFRSSRNSFSRFTRLFLISPDGTGLEEIPLHEAAYGSFSPDGKKMAYNRVSREGRTWKRYRGGLAQEIYLHDFETDQDSNATGFKGTDRTPMWIGDTVYFSSDRDGVLNLYSLDPSSGEINQVTRHQAYDVRRPSEGSNKIVYEIGGALWVHDIGNGESKEISVEIRADAPETRPYWKDVSKNITGIDVAPDGSRALITARGEVFSVPREKGKTRNLTRSSGARDQHPAWSPDGEKIAYISDGSGEYEITWIDPLGKKEAVQLTRHENGYRHTLRWSPDSKMIAFADNELACRILNIESRKVTKVDVSAVEPTDISLDDKPIHDFAWSPDSRFLAYSKIDPDHVSKIYIYSVDSGKSTCASQDNFNDFNPVFTADGKHLLFVSNRRFDPTYCDFEWEMVYKSVAGIYALTLSRNGEPLFGPPTEDDEDEENKEDNDSATAIDFEGLANRIEAVPLPRGNYRELSVNDKSLYYLNADSGDFNRFEYRALGPRTLHAFSLADRKEETVLSGVTSYRLSFDGDSIVYQKGSNVGVIASSAKSSEGDNLKLSDMKMWLDPVQEWTQIFHEAWRMERDFFYDENMHGLPWDAMKEKYGRLIPSASCRQDVRFIIGELIGELNASHTYVFGGEQKRTADRVSVGMLGVNWKEDRENQLYRFGKVFRVADWTQEVFPPLAMPGLNVEDGHYLLEVEGKAVTTDQNIYSYFQNLARKSINLLVNDKPTRDGAREITVKTLGSESTLRYHDWVEHNRKLVGKLSHGTLGYIHLPDTYNASAREFPKTFFSQTQKKGLVVDGRFNGGGLDPDMFLQRLHKKPLAYWTRRYSQHQTTPAVVTQAHMVCLTNRQAGSGGDMLPMEFRMKGMGPIIGTRTWGGLVGVSMFLSMVDGGGLTAPDYRIYDPQGKWVVENEGITPDIEVDLDPAQMMKGHDAQLQTGVDVLLKMIRNNPPSRPQHEPIPTERIEPIR